MSQCSIARALKCLENPKVTEHAVPQKGFNLDQEAGPLILQVGSKLKSHLVANTSCFLLEEEDPEAGGRSMMAIQDPGQ